MEQKPSSPWTKVLVVFAAVLLLGGMVGAKLWFADELIAHDTTDNVPAPVAPHAAVAPPTAAPPSEVSPAAPAIARLVQTSTEPEIAAGLAVYQESVDAIADIHRDLRDAAVRQKFIDEWKHKHDKDASLGTEKGLNHAIDELVWSLGQPHDYYDPPAMHDAIEQKVKAKIGGIGLPVSQLHFIRDAYALKKANPNAKKEDFEALLKLSAERPIWIAEEPPVDAPAAKAGIKKGDLLQAVDGQSVYGKTLAQVVESVRGDPTTKVKLTIARQGVEKPFDVEIERAEVKPPVVRTTSFPEEGIVQIKLQNFLSDYADEEMAAALKGAASAKGVILDLRNNSGGDMVRQIRIVQQYLEKAHLFDRIAREGDLEVNSIYEVTADNVVLTQTASDSSLSPRRFLIDRDYPVLLPKDKPLVVLIDGESASAAESTAGTLQAEHRAYLVGKPSKGKGVGQKKKPIDKGRRFLRITNFEFRPAGLAIDGVGVIPDLEVDQIEGVDPYENPDDDAQLFAARSVILNMLSGNELPRLSAEEIAARAAELKLQNDAAFAKELRWRKAVLDGKVIPEQD